MTFFEADNCKNSFTFSTNVSSQYYPYSYEIVSAHKH